MTKIKIGIDNAGVVCSPNGGHFRGCENARLAWESSHPFTLHFALLSGKGRRDWPFKEPPAQVVNVHEAEGTLALQDPKDPPAYKYTVVIEGYAPLDPVIIVDKGH